MSHWGLKAGRTPLARTPALGPGITEPSDGAFPVLQPSAVPLEPA